MKDQTSIKYFDKRFRWLNDHWWKPKCTRCNRDVAIDTFQEPDKATLKRAGFPKGYRINLCRECRLELKIRRIFDKK